MPWQSWYVLLGPAFLFPLLALRAEKMYSTLPKLSITDYELPITNFPSLSVIIPARNEEVNLQHLLPSICAVDYPGPLEVIVVDDGSTDQTVRVAHNFGAQVVYSGELPSDWLGKPHACHCGAESAVGEWFLFTDADTVHAQAGPRSAIAYAIKQELDGVSAFLRHETFGMTDRVVLMVAFAGLYAGMQAAHPISNGQYILIRREAYFQSGGFAAVRNEPLEDLALAHLLKKAGFRVPILHGDEVGSVRMYQNLHQLWNGMTRIGAGSLKWGGLGGVLTVLYITGALIPILAIPATMVSGMPLAWLAILWVLSITLFIPWGLRFGAWRLGLIAPFGALFVQVAAVWGLIGKVLGRGVRWKGREVIG